MVAHASRAAAPTSIRWACKDKGEGFKVGGRGMTVKLKTVWRIGLAALALLAGASAQAQAPGSASGLPVPRYVSLKTDRVNLREGPSKDHRTTWVFQRAGLPIEITAEFEIWRKVRDAEGVEGWVLHSLLSGRRTALVSPWKKNSVLPIYAKPGVGSPVSANLQAGVIGNIRSCDGGWCRVFGEGFDGFIEQANLWGVYQNEKVE